ncbi:ribonuclease Y [Candidatus Desantisbacteria bacterium CG1_02_38_46]|uniref:Ribonuclease Y n=3 Tax=unclassified Candidatus Desantisiibacteriota TaxID=3106372 RepID=A0A2H9PC02_9BACT|nr:MAG: ribonuclease Y [Candidatus Desantisbacteria bacterium CG1_02_38_46]PIU50976.1 MAG: ribonuclease Y [Candidatus Desantisbacteria bacterium CG07_land_8_20_14_0_80_39_15]PIZ16584.1 MAG: ribonuclease Y [Candidatus Desantisbacteria bacterium CG_4_10_14_0_8_um_filter_39_17]
MTNTLIVTMGALFLVGFGIGYIYRRYVAKIKFKSAEEDAQKIISDAKKQIEIQKKEVFLESKEKLQKEKDEFEKESKSQKIELQHLESRLITREESLDRKVEILEKKEKEILLRERVVSEKEKELERVQEEQRKDLQRIAGLTVEEAKKMLLVSLESKVRREANGIIKDIETKARETADKKAKEIIGLAIQRNAVEQTTEMSVSVVQVPDEMKGRVIGREGRNIRAIEAATGIDLIIDDTPGVIVLSGFDPTRREVARLTLEKLIADGRIQPTRIEETVEKVRQELENSIKEEGEKASLELGIQNLHPEEIKLVGRLKYRTSYGQNVLQHSKEVAYLAGMMASELGANVSVVKRAGLLHDIGKAVDHEVEGTHVQIALELARKFKEQESVIHAIACHHEDEEPKTVEAVLVQVADAISASRPGVRKETLESYMKRLNNLEQVAQGFPGIEKAYAIQAGREVRVIVIPEIVNDQRTSQLAKEIAEKIESELQYPGQIKVTVVRETRVTEYAK